MVRNEWIDGLAARLVEGFVGGLHVGNDRLPSPGRRLEAIEHGCRVRVRLRRAVGMPEGGSIAVCLPGIDPTHVSDRGHVIESGNAPLGESFDSRRAPRASEGGVDIRGELLVAQQEDLVLDVGEGQGAQGPGVDAPCDVDAVHLGSEWAGQWRQGKTGPLHDVADHLPGYRALYNDSRGPFVSGRFAGVRPRHVFTPLRVGPPGVRRGVTGEDARSGASPGLAQREAERWRTTLAAMAGNDGPRPPCLPSLSRTRFPSIRRGCESGSHGRFPGHFVHDLTDEGRIRARCGCARPRARRSGRWLPR